MDCKLRDTFFLSGLENWLSMWRQAPAPASLRLRRVSASQSRSCCFASVGFPMIAKAGSAEARFGGRTRKKKPTHTSRILGTTTQNIDQKLTQDNFQIHILCDFCSPLTLHNPRSDYLKRRE